MQLPPLKRRREDIPLLMRHFVERFAKHLNRPVPVIEPMAMDHLQRYDWPGNVRELEHLAQRALLVCKGDLIGIDDLPLLADSSFSALSEAELEPLHGSDLQALAGPADRQFVPLDDWERQYIVAALEASNWIVYGERGAAKLLQVHPEKLRAKMKKYGIGRPAKASLKARGYN